MTVSSEERAGGAEPSPRRAIAMLLRDAKNGGRMTNGGDDDAQEWWFTLADEVMVLVGPKREADAALREMLGRALLAVSVMQRALEPLAEWPLHDGQAGSDTIAVHGVDGRLYVRDVKRAIDALRCSVGGGEERASDLATTARLFAACLAEFPENPEHCAECWQGLCEAMDRLDGLRRAGRTTHDTPAA